MPKKKVTPKEKDSKPNKPPNQRLFDPLEDDVPQIVLRVNIHTPAAKPMNNSAGNKTYLFKSQPFPMVVPTKKKDEDDQIIYKIKELPVSLIKSSALRGILNHASMKVCYHAGIEVCHSTDRLTDKEGNKLLHKGFHPKGWCDEKNKKSIFTNLTADGKKERETLVRQFTNIDKRCILHQVYGSKHFASLFSVYAKPIIRKDDLDAKAQNLALIKNRFQIVQRAQDQRVVLAYDGTPVQNFAEDYFAGYFTVDLNVTKLSDVQLGFMLNSLKALYRLGRGYNSGYGRLFIDEFELWQEFHTKEEEFNGNKGRFIYHTRCEPVNGLMQQALRAWKAYVKTYHESKNGNN
ncbi:MAG: hypothetical protein ACFE9L_00135 [Candidatus Hodarchaeota archaeon]